MLSGMLRRDAGTPDLVLALLLLTTGGSSVYRPCGSQETSSVRTLLVYGRYAEVVAPPLLAVGLAAIGRVPLRRAAAAVAILLALTLAVVAFREGLRHPSLPASGTCRASRSEPASWEPRASSPRGSGPPWQRVS